MNEIFLFCARLADPSESLIQLQYRIMMILILQLYDSIYLQWGVPLRLETFPSVPNPQRPNEEKKADLVCVRFYILAYLKF